jgi:hypothetical protein
VLVSSNVPGTMQLFGTSRAGGRLTQITSFDEPVGGGYFGRGPVGSQSSC